MNFYQWAGVVLSLSMGLASHAADVVQRGSGAWRTQVSSADNPVPAAPFRTAAMLERAAPTNQWYSSVMFTRWSEVLHAVPSTAKARPKGLDFGSPQKTVGPTDLKDCEHLYTP